MPEPIVIDAPDEETTNPGHATRVGIFALKASIELLCNSVNDLRDEVRDLKTVTGALVSLRRLVIWCAVSAGALALVGALLLWSR